jgi:hypothetical protein
MGMAPLNKLVICRGNRSGSALKCAGTVMFDRDQGVAGGAQLVKQSIPISSPENTS